MTQEEILDYNKLCAEFLGWKYCKNDLVFNSKMDGHPSHNSVFSGWVKKEQTYTKGVPLFVVKQNRLEIEYKRKLLYHSDWNWIFEVVEAIEKLGYYTKNECIRNINYFNIYELENNEATFYGTDNSKKEAVVEAINQFLIWHKTNNNAK